MPTKSDCIPLLRALAAAILITAGCSSGGGGGAAFDAPSKASLASAKARACVDQHGYESVISVLPEISGDLVAFLNSPAMHPNSYQIPSSERIAAFEAWVADVLDGVDRMRRGESVNWCAVAGAKAIAAGYTLYRFHDLGPARTGRYFLLGQDTATGNQQAPFVINPEARRNIVLEAPHVPSDPGSGVGAARVFTSDLAPRAFILNGAWRCSLPVSVAPAECAGTTATCTGVQNPFPRSDMAHGIHTLFHSFHKLLSDRPPPDDRPFALPVRFAQFHTAPAEPVIATGTSDPNQPVPSRTRSRRCWPNASRAGSTPATTETTARRETPSSAWPKTTSALITTPRRSTATPAGALIACRRIQWAGRTAGYRSRVLSTGFRPTLRSMGQHPDQGGFRLWMRCGILRLGVCAI